MPCSEVMISASSPLRSLSSSRNVNSTAVRLASEVSRQAGERRDGGIDHRTRVLHAGQRDLTGHLTGRRIRHRRGVAESPANEALLIQWLMVADIGQFS